MPIEVGIWKLGAAASVDRLRFSPKKAKGRLEDILESEISILDPRLLLVGRQVVTAYGRFIDLLAMDADGKLIVVQLKRDRTPRDVIAQLLDIASIFDADLRKHHPNPVGKSLDQAFCERFGVNEMPESLTEGHELVAGRQCERHH